MSRRSRGFTLIELLVALAIFAILAGFAYRGLAAMLDSRASLERESRKWRDVALFVSRFERDLNAVIDKRVALGTSGTRLMPLSSLTESTDSTPGLSLSRSGSILQGTSLAAPQRVAYRFREGKVERLTWSGIDAAPRDEPAVVAVFSGATALTFRFLDATGAWRGTWGAPGSNETTLPAAVEMTIDLASGERITRLVDMPGTPS
ncbi:MAG TPA: type II secretion system minor pseudopilin GspJ [Usitatibacter sp.]|nr:type II secretion system minor pseudopilin GspJ [Usitatibacter sp.]